MTATSALTIPRGNYGLPLQWTLYQPDGSTPFNLSGCTVTFKVWKEPDILNPIVNGACSIVSDVNGTVTYSPVAADFLTPGTYKAEFQATISGVITVSFGQFTLTVTNTP